MHGWRKQLFYHNMKKLLLLILLLVPTLSLASQRIVGDLTVTGGATVATTLTTQFFVATSTSDINAGTIDGTTVGATSHSTGKFTTLEATSTLKLGTTNQGDVLYDNGTSLVRLPPGTSGHFFKTNGTGANPSWATAATSSAAGTLLVASADTERASAGASYTKIKEISIPRSGTLTISFELKSSGGGNTSARIYRNAVAVGTERVDTDAIYTTYSENISGWTAGDLCQLYIKEDAVVGAAKNFRIYELTGPDYVILTN